MKNQGIFLLIAAAALFFMLEKSQAPAIVSTDTTTKRNAIITYWQTNANPETLASDNGRFVDIIQSIAPAQIDTIYSYVFDYIDKNLTPPAALATAMQAIQTQYNILTS